MTPVTPKNELQPLLDLSLVPGAGWDWNVGLFLSDDPGVFFTEVDAYGFDIGVSAGFQYGNSPDEAGSLEASGGFLNVAVNGDPRTLNVNVYVGGGVSVGLVGGIGGKARTFTYRWSDLMRFLSRMRHCGLGNERGCR